MKIAKLTVSKKIALIAGGLILVSGAIIYASWNGKEDFAQRAEAVRKSIVEEVSVTGKTRPKSEIELAFETGGKIVKVLKSVGDSVASGEILAQIDAGQLLADLTQAQGLIDAAQAKLDALKRGTRPEDISVSQAQLAKAEQDLQNIYVSIPNKLSDAYLAAESAARKQLDGIFNGPEAQSPTLTFDTTDTEAKQESQNLRVVVSAELNLWKTETAGLSSASSATELENALLKSSARLRTVLNLLNNVMDSLVSSISLSSATVATYKTNVDTARTSVSASIAALTAVTQNLSSSKAALQVSQSQLQVLLAGTRPEDIRAQEAVVKQAQAQYASVQAKLAKTAIRSPIKGTVTVMNVRIGEIAAPNTIVASVISDQDFEIESNLTEVDVVKIKVGNPADITFDAYGDAAVFKGEVVSVEPAETVIEGIPTYKVVLNLTGGASEKIKSGLTANISIYTQTKNSVIVIPQRFVSFLAGEKKVLVLEGREVVERAVTTGIKDNEGNIEITTGLAEGEVVVIN